MVNDCHPAAQSVQLALPAAALCIHAGCTSVADVLLDAHACPESHGRQSASNVAPAVLRYRPGGHVIGALEPCRQYEPGGHALQDPCATVS